MYFKLGCMFIVVSEEMVMNMKFGVVIIDVSIDQGGCFVIFEVMIFDYFIFSKYEVIYYCVFNIVFRVFWIVLVVVSNILMFIFFKVGSIGSIEYLFFNNYGLCYGVYIYKGCLINSYLGECFLIKFIDLDFLIILNF